MPRRRGGDRREKEAGHERWLLTYADMITLLMAFFIMMYSMSVLNITKFKAAAISIRSGFGGIVEGMGEHLLSTPEQNGIHEPISPGEGAPRKQLQDIISSQKHGNQVEVRQETRGLVISIAAENLLFKRGSAELNPDAEKLLVEMSKVIKVLPNNILVEGHTCTMPISTPAFPSNWELSAVRACRVLRVMQNSGVSGWRMQAAGYGDMRPVVPNDNEEDRAKNRRVDIVLLNDSRAPSKGQLDGSDNTPEMLEKKSKIFLKIPKVWQ